MKEKDLSVKDNTVADASKKLLQIKDELKKVVVGQDEALESLILGLLSNAHILLEGMPGLAKTLMVRTLAEISSGEFSRIQFTPDLLPADIIGTQTYNQKKMEFQTRKGPVFSNFILADEINRAPPKVQSALLEAMQEGQVTIAGQSLKLPEPFLVLATQNPIEMEGTYPLPEAQVDRFMLKVLVSPPGKSDEIEIINRIACKNHQETRTLLHPEDIKEFQSLAKNVFVDDSLKEYVADIVLATRNPEDYGFDDLENYIAYGSSPRASIYLIVSAKAHALLRGRGYVTADDIKKLAFPVMRHRIIPTYEAEAEDLSPDDFIRHILDGIESP